MKTTRSCGTKFSAIDARHCCAFSNNDHLRRRGAIFERSSCRRRVPRTRKSCRLHPSLHYAARKSVQKRRFLQIEDCRRQSALVLPLKLADNRRHTTPLAVVLASHSKSTSAPTRATRTSLGCGHSSTIGGSATIEAFETFEAPSRRKMVVSRLGSERPS